MEINKQLFEDVLAGKLKGVFILRSGNTYFSADLYRNYNNFGLTHPYMINYRSYTTKGIFSIDDTTTGFDIIGFIPDTNMKENELAIEIPDGKIVDWDESKKQNKIVLKDKQLTYEDICKKLFKKTAYYTDIHGRISTNNTGCIIDSNNASTEHQLECILAKNKLANVAKYLNDGWKPNKMEFYYGLDSFEDSFRITLYTYLKSDCYGSQFAFKSKELACQAIKILGKETIKLALEPLGI